MSRRRRPRPPLPSPPARPGFGPVQAAPGCSEEPVRRGADRKEAKQEVWTRPGEEEGNITGASLEIVLQRWKENPQMPGR